MEIFKDIELVIFDLDGTICDLDIDWTVLKQELEEFFLNKYRFQSDFSSLDQNIERIEKELGSKAKEDAYNIVEKYETERINDLKPIEKTLKLIRQLKNENKRLMIFSSNLKITIERTLENLKIKDLFDLIIGKEDVEKHKPNPEGLKKILDMTNIEKDKVIYIGNKEKDIETGKKIGVKTILINEF